MREEDGSWWALVAVPGGAHWCHLIVVGHRCCPSFVPCCRSFTVVCSCLLFVHFVSLASGSAHLGRGAVDGAGSPLPLGRQQWSRRVSKEGSDRRGGTYSFIEYDDDDTIVVIVVCPVNPAMPLARPSLVCSQLCGVWATCIIHSWPVVIVGGLHGLWSLFADSFCHC